MLCTFLFRSSPCSPRSSTWLVLLFHCRTPHLCLVLSVLPDLWLLSSNHCMLSFLGCWPINVHFPFWTIGQSSPLYGHLPLLIALLPFCVANSDSPSESTPYYIRHLSHCNVSLVNSMQSSIVSSPTSKGTAPWEIPSLCPLVLHFVLPSHSRVTGPWT